MKPQGYPRRIGRRLVAVFVLFVASLIALGGWALYHATRASLDEELGDKLTAVARITASQVNATLVASLRRGDEHTRTYAGLADRLRRIQAASDARRIYVFDRDRNLLVDTQDEGRIGDICVRLGFDRRELASVWAGQAAHSLLFRGRDGRYYKSGYAPLFADGRVIAGVSVEAGARFVDTIRSFRRSVILFAAAGMLITVVIGLLFARTLTRPIQRLVRAAEEIGQGRLDREIRVPMRDELGYLADSLNEMRRSIVERDQQLRTMLASIAHEIRNPLGSIQLYAGLAADELKDAGLQTEHVAQIAREAGHLSRVITEFLDFARPRPPAPDSVALGDLVDHACFLLAFELDEKQIMVHRQFPAVRLDVTADPEQTKQVLINLFKNAIEAMEPGGRLTVRARPSGDDVLIEVEDTGSGIAPEALPRLFEPFYTTRDKGVGLGLSTVKKMVEDNHGHITVRSEPGQGTVFAFTLPRSRPGHCPATTHHEETAR